MTKLVCGVSLPGYLCRHTVYSEHSYCLQRKCPSVHINQAQYWKNAKNLCEEQCEQQCETLHKNEFPCSHSVYTEDVTLFTPKTAWCLHRNHRAVHINWRLRMTQWLATELREIRRALLVGPCGTVCGMPLLGVQMVKTPDFIEFLRFSLPPSRVHNLGVHWVFTPFWTPFFVGCSSGVHGCSRHFLNTRLITILPQKWTYELSPDP